MTYDLIIIGSGIAGITAAIYAKRSNLNVLILEKGAPGGLLNKIDTIKNYPGFKEITGSELAAKLFEQINELNVDLKYEEVINIESVGSLKKVETKNNEYITKSILIATGRIPKKLGLNNEDSLYGRGLSTCALCDGNFFKGKDVAVIGGGNSALGEALYLANLVNKVYIIHRRDEFRADSNLISEVINKDNIEIVYNSNVTNINLDKDIVTSITLDSGNIIAVSGVFVYVGFVPGVNFVETMGITNDKGYIITNGYGETKIPGIYAAGDIIDKQIYQLVTAASEGAIAAININNYCKKTMK
ncbi:MAG: FAD-dependent oxidoreductase [Bacilli bacterium]|nr:FAD-dependent oxidoreductase [Bacilli bacterium]